MPFNDERFIKLMMLSTSDMDGEALTAIRMANAMLAAENINWEEYISQRKAKRSQKSRSTYPGGSGPNSDGTYDDADEIETMFQALFETVKAGSSFREFIESVYDFWGDKGYLTERQYEAILKSFQNI